MSQKPIWVGPNGPGWQVKIEGNERASRVFDTKAEAEQYGRSHARELKTELIVQRRDGTIEYRSSFGNDPCPPKDKK